MLEDSQTLTESFFAFSNILAHIFQFFQMLSPCLRILTLRHSPPFLNRSFSFRRKIWLHREEWPEKDLSTNVGTTGDEKKSNQTKMIMRKNGWRYWKARPRRQCHKMARLQQEDPWPSWLSRFGRSALILCSPRARYHYQPLRLDRWTPCRWRDDVDGKYSLSF